MLRTCVSLCFACVWLLQAQNSSPPETAARAVLDSQCASCHGSAQMSGLDLRSREGMLKGGKRGAAVVPGHPEQSLLMKAILREGELKMPPGKQALASSDVAILREWIEKGAPW